ncbi:hypothetical protein GLOTRDRAFT_116659 [Gloeophyllum trabeum ATCC 11539]|uniref:DUF6534 domain-containing protein n=1 Tax=Gloeophyllum trabeum (strain ATCC 11539 / FP-39264 / Madison 617) TaxID=670483 RepID=S7Q300_GLOTA|nr:uncharacterized protein GLOTRDRAFT_116659 [Gloeophyllum trabeum ATCC 11539]EPQ53922.1 hypothetical protein GLOTRDRAFT_116659 [Gloeophyllum trabeum ATCC 11539]
MAVMDLVLGPTLIGVLFNVFLFGCVITQCYLYFITFKNDSPRIRFLVWFLLIADTLNSAFECVVAYEYTITSFGDYVAASNGNWRAGTGPVLIGVIAATVQGFFAWRVYRLTHLRWFFILICCLIFVQFVGAAGTGVAGSIIKPFAEWGRWQVRVPIVVWLVLAATVDCLLTLTMTFHLQRNRTGFAVTDHIVTKIIKLTVQTGMLTAVWAVLDLVLYLSVPQPVHLIFNLPLPKLYTNSLLSTLNARKNGAGDSSRSAPGALSDMHWDHQQRSSVTGIHVTTVATVHRDEFELSDKKPGALPKGTGNDLITAGDSDDAIPELRGKGEYSVKWK